MTTEYREIPIGQLIGRDDNLREESTADADLVASIRSVGILQPLRVVQNGKGYYVDAGHRRLDGARRAGLKVVPCVVVTDEAADNVAEYTTTMLVENLHRKDLSPLEEAEGYQRLTEFAKQAEIARLVGKPASQVSRRLSLLTLPPETQAKLQKGDLPLVTAEGLAQLLRLDPAVGLIACTEGWASYQVTQAITKVEAKREKEKATKLAEAHGLPIVKKVPSPVPDSELVYDTIDATEGDDEFEESYDPKDALGLAAAASHPDVVAFTIDFPHDDRADGRSQKLSVLPLTTREARSYEIPGSNPVSEGVDKAAEARQKAEDDRKQAKKDHEALLRSVVEGSLKSSDVALHLIQSELRDPGHSVGVWLCALMEWSVPEGDAPDEVVIEKVAELPAATQARIALAFRIDRGFSSWNGGYDEAIQPVLEKIANTGE